MTGVTLRKNNFPVLVRKLGVSLGRLQGYLVRRALRAQRQSAPALALTAGRPAHVGEISWRSSGRAWASTTSSTKAKTTARLSGGSDRKARTSRKPCA